MKWPRAGGILAHPTSFPGRFPIGDLGPGAIAMLDFLAAGGQRLWQVLPLGPTGYGNSPYSLLSAFAGNPLVIAPEPLLDEGLLTPDDLADVPPFDENRVDFGVVVPWKTELLHRSHRHFLESASAALRDEYQTFRAAQREWLEDYALFMALKAEHGGVAWTDWDERYTSRQPAALAEARQGLASEIDYHRYTQFLFFRQWARVRGAARARGIGIVGDLAIFVAHDSADVWAHPELFHLDECGRPTVVAGVPPDYFSETGQRWGNPIYRWDVLAETGYAWWVARVRQALEIEDIIRLDHFRGFAAYWEVPAAEATAVNGRWVPGPGDALFAAIREALGDVPFIAEDLGVITPDVVALRERLDFPGMRVLQFAFSADTSNHFLPHNYVPHTVVYTGTHDNDTTRGWYESLTADQRERMLAYLNTTPRHVVWDMIRAAFASVATLAIIPLQDPLNLGSSARMNFPSKSEGNWEWRATSRLLTPRIAEQLAEFVSLYGREDSAAEAE